MDSKKSGLSTASFVLGVVALITSFLIIGFVPSVVGLILGIIALNKNSQKGMTIAGIICSCIGIVVALIVLFSPSDEKPATVSNKDSMSVESENKENLADQVSHKIYAFDSMGDTFAYVVVTNNSDVPIDIDTNVNALDSSGNVIATYSYNENCIAPSQSYPMYHYFEAISLADIADYDYSVTVSRSDNKSAIDDNLDWKIENTSKTGVILSATNNNEYDLQYINAQALFFQDGDLVWHGDTYLDNVSDDCMLQAGSSVTKQIDCGSDIEFDNVEIYLHGVTH